MGNKHHSWSFYIKKKISTIGFCYKINKNINKVINLTFKVLIV